MKFRMVPTMMQVEDSLTDALVVTAASRRLLHPDHPPGTTSEEGDEYGVQAGANSALRNSSMSQAYPIHMGKVSPSQKKMWHAISPVLREHSAYLGDHLLPPTSSHSALPEYPLLLGSQLWQAARLQYTYVLLQCTT